MEKLNVEPTPFWLSTHIRPPCISTNCLEIARPRPVPPAWRVVVPSTWLKALNSLSLAVNVGEDPDSVFSFAGNTDFPVLFDRDSKAMAAWSVKGLPTTFLVDRQGRLAYRATGGREFDDPAIVALVRQLLKP